MFFPLMLTSGLSGFLDLIYESSNNWENKIKKPIFIYILWSDGKYWRTKLVSEFRKGDVKRIVTSDFNSEVLINNLALVYPSLIKLDEKLSKLPNRKVWFSEVPAWRNTSGFYNQFAQVSYQADIEPLPAKASLLTFHPFIQFEEIENNLLILNVTSSPDIFTSKLKVFDSANMIEIGEETIKTNTLTTIPIDKYGFKPTDLPIFYSPEIAAIPFGLGISNDKQMISLEHTHPPASLVLHGDRRTIQGKIKKNWVNRIVSAK
jgi:hypothetical protein